MPGMVVLKRDKHQTGRLIVGFEQLSDLFGLVT